MFVRNVVNTVTFGSVNNVMIMRDGICPQLQVGDAANSAVHWPLGQCVTGREQGDDG